MLDLMMAVTDYPVLSLFKPEIAYESIGAQNTPYIICGTHSQSIMHTYLCHLTQLF